MRVKIIGLLELGDLFAKNLWLFVEVWAKSAALDDHAEDVFEGQVGLLDIHGDL